MEINLYAKYTNGTKLSPYYRVFLTMEVPPNCACFVIHDTLTTDTPLQWTLTNGLGPEPVRISKMFELGE